MLAAGVGAPAGFLARISQIEREISFLKQKVEDDAHWKHIMQTFILDNFAFDIQGTLLHGSRRRHTHSSPTSRATPTRCSTTPATTPTKGGIITNTASTPTKTTPKKSSPSSSTSQIYPAVKIEQEEPIRTRYHGVSYQNDGEDPDDISPTGFMDDDDDEDNEDDDMEQLNCFGGVMEDGMEVNFHPKDLIITPDICAATDTAQDKDGNRSSLRLRRSGPASKTRPSARRTSSRKTSVLDVADKDDTLGEIAAVAAPEVEDNQQSDSESGGSDSFSEEELQRRPHRKMEWSLISTYPNVQTMKQQFNLREWGLSTKQITDAGSKYYYYCKECRKHGPGRLLVRYKNEGSEVEVLKNQLEHDHSTKKRLTEEMKVEIVNLFKAGITDSTKILAALHISKPHMRQPSIKQICHIVKPFRKVERKRKLKEKKKVAKEKEQQKLANSLMDLTTAGGGKKPRKRKNDSITGGGSLSNFPLQSSSTTSSAASTPSSRATTTTGGNLNLSPQHHLGQFMASTDDRSARSDFPHIVSVTGFPTPSQQLQQFYQQQHSFDHATNPSGHLGQHYP